jgi:urea carboxylase
LKLREYQQFLRNNQVEIQAFKQKQQAAFDAERQRWEETGQANFEQQLPDEASGSDAPFDIPAGCIAVASPVTSSVWKISVKRGDRIDPGDELIVVEAMKMEITIESDEKGVVEEILCSQGASVHAGQALVILRLDEA